MSQLFDSKVGLVEAKAKEYVRDVSDDLAHAEDIIRKLPEPMFVEDLIKLVQKTCSLTNDEVFEIVKKVDAELKPKADESSVANPV